MVDKNDEDLQLQEAIARPLDIKSLSKNSSSTSLKAEAAATQSKETLKPHENLGTNKADNQDRADIKGKRKSDIGVPKPKSHISQKASLDDIIREKHKASPKTRMEFHSDIERLTHHPDYQPRSDRRQEAPSRSAPESSGGGGLFSILGKGLSKPFASNNHGNNSNKSRLVSSSGSIRSAGGIRSGDLSYSDRNEQRPILTHKDHEMIARARQDALLAQQMSHLHNMHPPEMVIRNQGIIQSDRRTTIMHSSITITGGGGGYPSPEILFGPAFGGGRQTRPSNHPIDSDLYNPAIFDDYTAEPPTSNKSRCKNPSPSSFKSKSAASITIRHALQELQEDKGQYLESLLEFIPAFQFNEKPLKMILLQMNESNLAECMEIYTTELQKQYVDASAKLIEAMDVRTEKGNTACLEMEATVKKLEEVIASQNQTSLEIQEKLQEKSFELQVDRNEIAQDYKLLKENLISYFGEEEVDLNKEKKEKYVKDMIQLLIEKTVKCHLLQQSVQNVKTLFDQSGHHEWIEEIKLQIVQSLYVSAAAAAKSDPSEIQLIKDKRLSEFEARNDMTLKNRKSSYLEECIIIAERLSKYAIAESYYFPGGLSIEALDQL